jgi:hypothetical protein
MGEVLGVWHHARPVPDGAAPENLLRFRKMLCAVASSLSGKPFVDPPEAVAEMGERS